MKSRAIQGSLFTRKWVSTTDFTCSCSDLLTGPSASCLQECVCVLVVRITECLRGCIVRCTEPVLFTELHHTRHFYQYYYCNRVHLDVTKCICTLCLCCCSLCVALSVSVSNIFFFRVWGKIMTSIICNNSFMYVLHIIILDVTIRQ